MSSNTEDDRALALCVQWLMLLLVAGCAARELMQL